MLKSIVINVCIECTDLGELSKLRGFIDNSFTYITPECTS